MIIPAHITRLLPRFCMKGKNSKKNIILFVGKPTSETLAHLNSLREKGVIPYKNTEFARIREGSPSKNIPQYLSYDIIVDFSDPESIAQSIASIKQRLKVVTCRSEAQIPQFAKLVPHIKDVVNVPTPSALLASTDKLEMRKKFKEYDHSITPKFLIAPDAEKETIDKIEKRLGYPLIVKPVGLAQSLLVTMVFHRDELQKALKVIIKNLAHVAKETNKKGRQAILVEQFIEGDQYSIDAYINSKGKIKFCPMVYVKTGKSIGFDDFFGYQQLTPTKLLPSSIKIAQTVASDSIRALGLTSSSAHIELIRTEDKGWKVIELGPRIGGFRDSLYNLSFGIDHTRNDIEIRMDRSLVIPKRVKGYSVAMKVYAREEGTIQAIQGIKKIKKLDSFKGFEMGLKKIGDKAVFAKHGGRSVFNVILFNKNRSNLFADMRRIENMVHIKVEPKKKVRRK